MFSQFSDKNLCTRFIHELLGVNESVCGDLLKIQVVKNAWMFGHEHGVLTDDMYAFGLKMFKLEQGQDFENTIKVRF